jgi:NTP pyrophosphatase (non-canonical NTP hydrolase)
MLPNLNPAQAERLAILAEECGEIVQVIGKILRHGFESTHPEGGPTNRQLLELELGDITAVIGLCLDAGDVAWERMADRLPVTTERLKAYTHHQPPELFE